MINTDKNLTDNGHKQSAQPSLQLLPLIMNNIPQAIFWKNRDLVYLGCNQAFADDAGFSSTEEVIGKTDYDMPWKDQAELYRADDRRVLDTGESKLNYEEPQTTPDGSTIWLRTSKTPVRENDQVVAILGMYEDITAYKKAQEASEVEKQRFQTILETVRVPTVISRLSDGIVLYANQAIAQISQVKLEKLVGFRTGNFYANPDDQVKLRETLRQHGHIDDFEIQFRRTDGSLYWALLSARIIDYEGEKCVLSTYIDITERKRMEEDLLLRDRALASSLNAVLVVGLDFKPIYVNESFLKMTGYTYEEAMQLTITDLSVYPEGLKRIDEATHTQGFFIGEESLKRKDGSIFPTDFFTSYITDDKGEPIAIQTAFTDITERKHAEQALQENQKFLQTVMDNIPQSIFWKDNNLTYLGCNSAFASDAGVNSPSDIVGKNDWDMPWKEQAELYRADDSLVMKNGVPKLNYEEPQTNPQGQITWLRTSKIPLYDSDGNVSAVLGMYEDITERKRLEDQIREALERRGLQVQLSTQVSQSIATASSLEELYERVVTQVKEEFGYYHTQLLRYDPNQEAVVLVTGYGEIGAKMLTAGHRLPMGEGLIGTAAASGETILRPALENDPDWHANPLLPETKGEIAVPIKLGDTILGVLDVQSNVAGALDADDQLLLEGLCGQIAVAIESTRLRADMSERLEEINRLYGAMSHEGWQTYRQSADVSSGFIFDQAGLRPARDIGLAEELFAAIPLTVPGGEVIGSLAVTDDPQRPLSAEDEVFLQQVSEQVALALESARLFEQTQTALSEVQRRASELETVAELSATTSSVLDPDQLLQSVVDLAKERFGLYHAHIYTYDESWNTLLLTAGAGEIGRKLVAEEHAIPLTIEQSIVVRAARERKPVIVNDVNSEPSFLPNPLLPETYAEMAVPMTAGDKLLGVFDVQSNNPAGFSDRDANIYVTLAAQVAVALQNARLYVEQAALVTQLRELDRLKSSFLANMSHELRTPLNSILGFADVIIEELDGPLTENMSNDLRLIQKNGQHLLHLINDVLDMAKIEAGRMNLNPERFTACEVLEEVTSITSTLASEKNISLFIEEDSNQEVKIYADRTRLRQVMINLVNNAIKFTENGKIALKVATMEGARILVTVKDTGIGIPPDKLDAIFQEFTQVDSSSTRKAGGTGLGLPISRKLVEMHGGRLWAESTGVPGEGSTFFVELPVEARITETIEKQVK